MGIDEDEVCSVVDRAVVLISYRDVMDLGLEGLENFSLLDESTLVADAKSKRSAMMDVSSK